MKICIITHNIFTLGGVQRIVSVLANELSVKHEITILCTDNKINIDRGIYNLNERVNIENYEELFPYNKYYKKIARIINKTTGIFNNNFLGNVLSNIYYPRKLQNKMTDYLNKSQYDIVIAVEGIYSLFLGKIASRINAKTIGWQHNSYDAYLKNKYRYHWNEDILFEKYIPKLDNYVVLTEYDARMFKEEKNIDCKVIYNIRSFKSEEKSDMSKKCFLAAGRFTYQKGFDMLIKAFAKFCENDKDWKLIIVGDGEEKKNIEGEIEKLGLSKRVELNGFTDDIKKYFLQASVLLLPSRWEGMPMIVLEALEMGVPTISFDITASEQLIDNNLNGKLVDKYNIIKFSEAMLELSSSVEVRKEMSEYCLKKSKLFSSESIIEKWNEIINEN